MAIIFSQPHNGHLRRADPKLTRTIPVEKWRCIAYFFFWTMCGLAYVMSKIFVAPMLLNGPVDGTIEQKMGCGPFDRVSRLSLRRNLITTTVNNKNNNYEPMSMQSSVNY